MKCKVINHTVFKDCPVSELQKMMAGRSFVSLNTGDELYRENTPASGIFCLYEGKVKLVRKDRKGKFKTLHIAKPGDVMAVHDVINNSNYSSTGIAEEDSKACFIPSNDFIDLIKKNTSFSLYLMRHLLEEIKDTEKKLEKAG